MFKYKLMTLVRCYQSINVCRQTLNWRMWRCRPHRIAKIDNSTRPERICLKLFYLNSAHFSFTRSHSSYLLLVRLIQHDSFRTPNEYRLLFWRRGPSQTHTHTTLSQCATWRGLQFSFSNRNAVRPSQNTAASGFVKSVDTHTVWMERQRERERFAQCQYQLWKCQKFIELHENCGKLIAFITQNFDENRKQRYMRSCPYMQHTSLFPKTLPFRMMDESFACSQYVFFYDKT